ncbi:hypothetical protein C900_04223 [Fulvivirga imtechensis AK7]|uniref:FAD-dependent urate hydroxylase HpyO/Asp monooxygenase CreE-like FAD/NAD(P)-binding domain-containing protein n=1 Tax=Fulvivirga imtechensis AK7 TaxID=1237149 RepID=L8JWF5_9BACT|nr:FAD/NAD(P)-binding protein [Fulvivirga imtechensis]ELR73371.1 hypothetical protein C900_04223 [Fulvivirga imtechensis AK7]
MESHAIVGGGLSGTLTTIRLLERSIEPLLIHIFEKYRHQFAKGVAYASKDHCHLLNVPAKEMSIHEDKPDDFCRWLLKNGYIYEPNDFVPRWVFGHYLSDSLEKAIKRYSQHQVYVHYSEITNLDIYNYNTFTIRDQNQQELTVQNLWLCIGNLQPHEFDIKNNSDQRMPYISNPWDVHQLKRIHPKDDVLIIGSGLTMIDQVLSLKQKNHQGKITVISRRGLIPQPHKAVEDYSLQTIPNFNSMRVVELLHWIRKEICYAEKKGIDWRSVINAVRNYTPEIWKNLSKNDRISFLTHLRPYWETSRHRVPAESYEIFQSLREKGRLELMAARIKLIRKEEQKLLVDIKVRQCIEEETLEFDWLINCTGPQAFGKHKNMPFFKSMISAGVLTLDELNLGIRISPSYKAIGRLSSEIQNLHVIGPPGKGSLWECTALKEIRTQTDLIKKKPVK